MIDYPTEAQSNNVRVINCLWAFKQGLEDITATSQNVDEVSMAEVDRLCHAVLDPLVESATDSIEAILLTMHSQEDLGQALFLCNIYVGFRPVVPFRNLHFVHALTNATDDHKYSPLPSTDFDIAKVLVSFSAFIFS